MVGGRVDVKAWRFCVEVEISGRIHRLEHAIDKLASSACGGGFLIVSPKVVDKATRLTEGKRNIIVIPSDRFKKLCKIE